MPVFRGSYKFSFSISGLYFYMILFVSPFAISLIFSYFNGDSFSARAVIEFYLLMYTDMILSLVNILRLKGIFKERKLKRQAGRNKRYNLSKQMTILGAMIAPSWTGGFTV